MKIKLILTGLILMFFTSCEKDEGIPANYSVELEGAIQEMGPTI